MPGNISSWTYQFGFLIPRVDLRRPLLLFFEIVSLLQPRSIFPVNIAPPKAEKQYYFKRSSLGGIRSKKPKWKIYPASLLPICFLKATNKFLLNAAEVCDNLNGPVHCGNTHCLKQRQLLDIILVRIGGAIRHGSMLRSCVQVMFAGIPSGFSVALEITTCLAVLKWEIMYGPGMCEEITALHQSLMRGYPVFDAKSARMTSVSDLVENPAWQVVQKMPLL